MGINHQLIVITNKKAFSSLYNGLTVQLCQKINLKIKTKRTRVTPVQSPLLPVDNDGRHDRSPPSPAVGQLVPVRKLSVAPREQGVGWGIRFKTICECLFILKAEIHMLCWGYVLKVSVNA